MREGPGRRRATGCAVTLALVAALATTACDPAGVDQPELPKVAGLLAPTGALQIRSGTPCESVTRIRLMFSADDGALVRTVAEAAQPRTLEELTVGVPPDGFSVTEPLPAGFDWRDFDELSIDVSPAEGWVGQATVPLDEVAAEFSQHAADDMSFVPGSGWLTADEVAALDGDEFLMLCTPEPASD